MKRANGTGTIRKLSRNRRKRYAAYRHAVTVGDTCVRKLIGCFDTRSEAERAILADVVMPVSEYASITLRGLLEMWSQTRAYTKLTRSTQQNYSAAFSYIRIFV